GDVLYDPGCDSRHRDADPGCAMTKRRRRTTIGDLLERARRGEELNASQHEVVAAFTDVLDKVRTRLEPEASELLTQIAEDAVPAIPGTSPNEQTRTIEAEAKQFWRESMQRLKSRCVTAADAREQTARAIRERWPRYQNKSTKTITDRMQRR